MPTEAIYLMLAAAVMLLVIGGLSYISHRYSLGNIKSRKLKRRVVFYCDELGTIPPIDSLVPLGLA